MYAIKIFLLAFFNQCSDTLSSSDLGIFKKEYLNPKSVDHGKFTGRWYTHMDTLNNNLIDNAFGDVVLLCDKRIVHVIHRWIPSLEECHTTAVVFQFTKSDAPEGVAIRMSTNEVQGNMTVLYFDPHPTEGFLMVHRQTRHVPDSYFISSRQKDPDNIDEAINQVIEALHLDIEHFYVKSMDFGCERREESGIKL